MITLKSHHEIELMREAGRLVAQTHELLRSAIKPGITTAELDRMAESFITSHNAIPSFKGYSAQPGVKPFPASICASVNDEVVHGIPSDDKVLQNGDIISIDIGAILNGYHGDAARTYAVGEISDDAMRLIDVTRQSFFEGFKFAMHGHRLTDISNAIQQYVESNGYSVVREYLGHGIGKEMHEDPPVPNFGRPGRGPRLEAGMTLAIEPMVNMGTYRVKVMPNMWTVKTQDGSLSAHYENTIAITEQNPIILTEV
ncbi:MAG: methionyl aminopeptidase [Clostridiales bacterium]|jgi:methionyl aminopeptidase|nr:methionyl aminopeptidase [Clostridiales bacterium]MDK2992068.1 methionyl aminopeptidase [Clostridiales bacterium]